MLQKLYFLLFYYFSFFPLFSSCCCCSMALPSDAMASVQFDSMTNVRSSTDYGKEETRRFYDAILALNPITVPRQARDKHRESTQKRGRPLDQVRQLRIPRIAVGAAAALRPVWRGSGRQVRRCAWRRRPRRSCGWVRFLPSEPFRISEKRRCPKPVLTNHLEM